MTMENKMPISVWVYNRNGVLEVREDSIVVGNVPYIRADLVEAKDEALIGGGETRLSKPAQNEKQDALSTGECKQIPMTLPQIIKEAMQDAWNDYCTDTGSYPPDFEYKKRKLYFQAGEWAQAVADRVTAALADREG